MRVAYLVNQYPRTSHSFIRREIVAVEAQGVEVLRFSLRPLDQELVTQADRDELARTRVVLDAGAMGHAWAVLCNAIRSPASMARALRTALRLGWRSDRGVPRHLAYLAEACVLARWLRRARAEHLHAHFGTNSAAVALLCREVGGPPYSFTVHGSEEFDKPEFLKLREKVQRSAFAVAISSFGRAQLLRWADPDAWDKVHVIRCGVDEALLGVPASPVPAARRLVCVARLIQLKGHLVLVEAAARLAAEGIGVEIVLAGDGPFRARVEAAIREAGVGDSVRVAGWMSGDQVRDAIRASRALVLPSFSEGLPIVVMEALALGRPVITTALAGIPELVEPGVTGWMVPPASVDALVAAMRDALEASPEELGRMGRAGAARVARDHDANREAEKLVSLFRAAAGATAGSPGAPGSRPR